MPLERREGLFQSPREAVPPYRGALLLPLNTPMGSGIRVVEA
jgi:hypothetical protein